MKLLKQKLQDRNIEQIMGTLLQYGVLAALLVVLPGAILYLMQHGSEKPFYRQFTGEPKRLIEIRQVWQSALEGRGRSIIQLGIFILIGTPVARIVFSVIGYMFEKDYLYVLITLVVLCVILFSL